MQYNLEGISFDEVVNNKGTSYATFRSRLQPIYSKVWWDIFKGYFFLLLASTIFIYLDNRYHSAKWILIIPFAILTGYVTAFIALFIHEAGHFNIHPSKKTNDTLATLFLCLPFGLSMKSYRKIHWQHHLYLGTPQDTEVSYFNALTKLFILETLTGIHLIRTILKKGKSEVLTKEQVRQSRIMLFGGLLFHSIILVLLIYTNNWAYAITWVLGFGVFFPFFATIRQLLEHRDELAQNASNFRAQPHGKVTRLFVHTLLSSSFGAAGFTRHLIHHWDPQISYTRLGEIEEFLLNCERVAPVILSSKTTYLKTVKKLLAAP